MKGATPSIGNPQSGHRPALVSDSTILAMLIPALDGPTPPKREWWSRTFNRTPEQIDALFEIAHDEKSRAGAYVSILRERPEATDE